MAHEDRLCGSACGDPALRLAALERGHLTVPQPLGLETAPPTADPVHERDVIQLALVGGVRFKVGIVGDPPKAQRFAEAAGGHAATCIFLGHAGGDPAFDFIRPGTRSRWLPVFDLRYQP
jgi:hypothetical protein